MYNYSTYTQMTVKNLKVFFVSVNIKMGKMIKRSIVPKRNFKKLMSTLLPIVKKVVKIK